MCNLFMLQEFLVMCSLDHGVETVVSREVLYFYNNGSVVINKDDGERVTFLLN